MAGPAIRCWEMARALSADAEVVLLAPAHSDLEPEGFKVVTYQENTIDQEVKRCDALICQGYTLDRYPDLASLDKFLIIDLYVPLIFEALVHYEHQELDEQVRTQGHILMATIDRLAAGHFFICASERQRDFWLGWLAAAGRLTPAAYRGDPAFRRLIDVVPFGLPDSPPAATGKVLKGVHPGIAPDDKVLLWGGGIYNWLDPFTPIRAMEAIAARRSDVKLFFLGARHPDPNVPAMRVYDEAVALSEELGLLGGSVFFNDRWVPYQERVDYLLESDLGVSANTPHVETRFSFRTRILDCIWAGLPVAATDGDPLSDLVAERGLGLVTPSGDAGAFAGAIERLLDDRELAGSCRANMEAAAEEFRWSRAVEAIRRRLADLSVPGNSPATPERLGGEELWRMVASKEADIEKLWAMVREKDGHIENLWEMVRDKDGRIRNFQKIIADKDRQLRRLLPETYESAPRRWRLSWRRARETVRAYRKPGKPGRSSRGKKR